MNAFHFHKQPAAPRPMVSVASHQPVWIARGTAEYTRSGIALFLAGFASFSLLYCVQPLLPVLASHYGVSPAESSLALSLTTGFLAIAIVLAGAWSQGLSRKGLMFASMALGASLNMIAVVVPGWHALLQARACEGFVLGGVPAVAMAWLSEEIDPRHLGRAMGLYVAGTAFGGMAGRVGMGVLIEFIPWKVAMGGLAVAGFCSALGFLALLPASRNFVPQRGLGKGFHLDAWRAHLHDPVMVKLYVLGFLLTSIFVTLFNYSTFLLTGAPFFLSPVEVSLIFLTYAFGIVASTVAGNMIARFGRRNLLLTSFSISLAGILLTLASSLVVIVAGIAFVTVGFFIGHSAASSSVGALSKALKGHASSLYLLFYYLGSSTTATVGGWFWQGGGWPAVAALGSGIALLGGSISLTLGKRSHS